MIYQECPTCKGLPSYDEEHDADFCSKCDAWLEGKCSDAECDICTKRPDKPSDVKDQKKNGAS